MSGLPIIFEVKPGMYIDRFDDMIAAACEAVQPAGPPGERLAYSPLANHVLMAEALRRTDPKGRSYRAMVQEELLTPLKMQDTAVGLRADLKPRHVVPDFRGNYPIGHAVHSNLGPNGAFEEEHAEMPWVGMRRGQHHLLGGPGARYHVRVPVRRGYGKQREHRALSASVGHRDFGRALKVRCISHGIRLAKNTTETSLVHAFG